MDKKVNDYTEIAVVLGRRGGLARARNMSPGERSASSRKCARIRWDRYRRIAESRKLQKQQLIKTAKSKSAEARLSAFFVLSKNIADLSGAVE